MVLDLAPVRLLARERLEIFNGAEREVARATLLDRWQSEWNESTDGRWTYRLIKDLKKWCSTTFGKVTFHITQQLTGLTWMFRLISQ